MRPILLALIALVLLAGGSAAGGASTSFGSEGSTCGNVKPLGIDRIPGCPHVRQSGSLAPGACAGDACALLVRGSAEATGLPLTDKSLTVGVHFTSDAVPLGVLCAVTGAAIPLECAGETTALVPLADGACRGVVVRAALENVGRIPGVLGVVTQTAFTLCRAGDALHVVT